MESESIEYIRQKGLPLLVETLLSDVVKHQPDRPYDHVNLLTVLAPITTLWPSSDTTSLTPDEKQSCHSLAMNVFPYYENKATHGKLLLLLEYMFNTLGAQTTFSVKETTLRNFILRCYESYNDTIPFHNFRHAFNVTQTYFYFATTVQDVLKPLEMFAGLVAALCHDLGHPGTNNPFHENTASPIAIRYNNVSVLENYHCAYAFDVLKKENLLEVHSARAPDDAGRFRDVVIACILATDVSKHKYLLSSMPTTPDWANGDHRKSGVVMLVECADISNEVRDHSFSLLWAPLVSEEFFRQGDVELGLGMVPKPSFTRGVPDIAVEQIGFITYLCVPAYKAAAMMFPKMQPMVDTLARNIEAWGKLKKVKK